MQQMCMYFSCTLGKDFLIFTVIINEKPVTDLVNLFFFFSQRMQLFSIKLASAWDSTAYQLDIEYEEVFGSLYG